MPVVIGISLRTAGKIYYFDPGTDEYRHGERVLVETARGPELGTVRIPAKEVTDEQIVPPLKPIVRRATAEDMTRDSVNREREEHALKTCKRLVEKLNLPMRLIDAHFTLDGSHVLIFFLSENRVDFRELVRELAHELRARIELRQVGVRDEAKLLGGYGICGQRLCCSAFLDNFVPVAISMAKDQGLALNPQKISGTCGRLMCCLAFECNQYRTERADLPRLNTVLETPAGVGKVTKLNVMSRQIEVTIPDAPAPVWFSADDLLAGRGTASCCATHQHAECGSPCGKCAEPSVPKLAAVMNTSPAAPEMEPVAAAVVSEGQESGAEQPKASRTRRRRKRPSTNKSMAATAPVAETAIESATRPPAPDMDGQTPKAKRPRRRRSRSANPQTQPAQAPAETSVAVSAPVAENATTGTVPSGRYRPRRRRTGGKRPPAQSPSE